MGGPFTTLRAVVGLAGAQLRFYRLPSALAVAGVALAVLLMVLLTGLGHGVTTAGTEGLDWLDQDLWVSAGPIEVAPGAVGGVKNPLLDAHTTADRIAARDDVRRAEALAFQAVYVSPNTSAFVTVVGVGGTGNSSSINLHEGPGFHEPDVHYANGTYAGPMTHEVIIDERTAAMFDVAVGDSLYIGGTIATAREHRFEVVGISPTFSTFLGTATVTLHLSELQTLTGTTGTDPASLIAVSTAPNADREAVAADLEREYPGYSVRSNREQLRAVLGRQSSVLASAVALVVVALLVGTALVVNVLGLLVHHQRTELAALRAAGVRSRTLLGVVGGQAVAIGLLGGGLGLLAAPAVASLLNPALADLAGFPKLVKLPWWILTGGGMLAFLTGVTGAVVAAWSIGRLSPVEYLRP